jgi:hypothetical protein
LFEHDLFGKPVSTFPDHALALQKAGLRPSAKKSDAAAMAMSPDHAASDRCPEAVERQVEGIGENVVGVRAHAGALDVDVFNDTGMDAADPGKADHRRSMNWQSNQCATFQVTFQHGGNSR